MGQRGAWVVFAFVLLVGTGCRSTNTVSSPYDGGTDPGTDAAEADAASPDGGHDAASPDAQGTDAGSDGATPYDEYGACEIDKTLAFVNDDATSKGMLKGTGLTWEQANAVFGGKPFADAGALDRVLDSDDEAWALLVDASDDDCPLPGDEPELRVRFTDPQCDAVPDHDVPDGVRCYGERDEIDESIWTAGIVDHLLRWIDMTRRVKEAHPERDVRIVMAFLTWTNPLLYEKLCAATAAGVQFEGFFDEGTSGSQPDRLANDPDCAPENVDVSYLGGVTEYPDWRLMHVKMMRFDTGGPTARIVFGSANASTYGTTLHHENWVFARFPEDARFVAAHDCAAEALYADRYRDDGSFPDVFGETYSSCADGIEAAVDSRYRVFFTRSDDPLSEARSVVASSEETLDVAIQHFSARELVEDVAGAGGDAEIATRLVLDDDTFYGSEEEGGASTDHDFYEGFLRDSGAEIRFLQTNGHLDVGAQYQHNKLIVSDRDTVFCGAGNFTAAAFEDNYENFYVIEDSEIASTMADRIERLHGLGAEAGDLPERSDY